MMIQDQIVQHRHHSSSSPGAGVSLTKDKQRWSDITSNSEDGCQESENSVRNSESSNNSNSDLTDLDQMSESRLNGYHEQLLEALRATAAVGMMHSTVGGSSNDDRDSGRETHSGRPSPKLTGNEVGGRKGSGGGGGHGGSGERTGSASGVSREETGRGGGHEGSLSKKSSFSALGRMEGDPLSDYSGKNK